MKTFTKNILNKNIFKNILILFSGTAFAQLVGLLAIPFITRIYGPEAYGVMGAFIAVIAIIAPISALTYPIAIVLPKSEILAKKIIVLSFYITIAMSFLSFIIILIFHNNISKIFNLSEIENYFFLIPLVVVLSGFLQIIEQYLIRQNNYSVIAKTTVKHSLIVNSLLIIGGFIKPTASLLITIHSIKSGIKSLLMSYKYLKINNIKYLIKFKHTELYIVMKKYRDFPIYRAPEVVLNSTAQSLPILLLTVFFSPIVAGYYTLSRMALGLPSQLIGKSIGDVFYPSISRSFNKGIDISKILIKATFALSVIGLIPFGFIFFYGPDIFNIIFGSEWYLAGEYARWLSLWSFCMFINIPSIKTLPVLSAQAFHLKYSLLMLIIRTLSMIVAYYFYENEIVVIQYAAVSSAVLNLLLIFLTIRLSKKSNSRLQSK